MQKLLVLAALVIAVGCSPDTPTSALKQTVDQRASDITVLQAWHGKSYALDLPGHFPGGELDKQECSEVGNYSSGSAIYRTVRCSSELERKAKLDGFADRSPLLNDSLHMYASIPSEGREYWQTGRCEIVEFRTVIRDAALNAASFTGIGFYLSPGHTQDGSTRFYVAKNRLHAVGHVTLVDGSPATVHRFIAQGMCFGLGGNGGSIYSRRYKFRPYARFASDGFEHQVWDDVAKDYLLGLPEQSTSGTPRVESFDRQLELLKQQ